MDSDVAAKLKAEILESVGDLIDEKLGGMAPEPGPRLVPRSVEQEPSVITVFEWSHFAGDPEGFYVGSKVGYASKNMSLKCVGPHESMICYDAVTEELRLYGDVIPKWVRIGKEVLHTSPSHTEVRGDPLMARDLFDTAPLCREAFRELLVEVRKHHNSHWQAVIDGFDRLPPADKAA